MHMRFLGNTGVKVSELCFGTMTFGGEGRWKHIGEQDQETANRLVSMAIDAGINFFDTADVYSRGTAEVMLGKALGSRRDEVIIATKVFGRMSDNPNNIGLSRYHIIKACEDSLRRLGTDCIDLYQVHNFDYLSPLDETLRALDDLVRQGKVRYIGCSNYAGWHLMKALSISEHRGWERFITLQAYYSLMNRDLEHELIPLCLDQKVGILCWSPLSGGFLSGKYRRDSPRPQGARLSSPDTGFLKQDEEKGYAIVVELDAIARERGRTIPQAALNYLLRKPGITSVIIGARTVEQLEDNLKASDWELSLEEIARLDSLSEPPRAYPYWMHRQSGWKR